MPMMSISVIIMLYNEQATVANVVQNSLAILETLTPDHEVVIVDDGSTDGSHQIAEQLAQDHTAVRCVPHPHNKGLGEVYRTGFAAAQKDLITFFPADGQFPSEAIGQLYPHMADHDLTLGYIISRKGVFAKLLSNFERILYSLLFGKMPRFQGVFMLRTSVLEAITLKSTGRAWTIVMEMIIRVKDGGYRITSIPTAYRPRETGQSKVMNWRTIWVNLQEALKLRMRY